MGYELNRKICDLIPYEPISGDYSIRLDANESPESFPPEITQQIKTAVDSICFNRYPDPYAKELISAFADYYNIDPTLVTAGNGSDELIFLIESAFLEKGDKMLVVSPDFSMYSFYSSICEVECDTFYKDNTLNIDVDSLINRINANNIKLLIFSNPCNPTGQGITAQQVQRLISSVNALVVLDEAYMDFWDQSLINQVNSFSNLIVLRTASKAVGSAALRLGFAISNRTVSDAIKAVKSPYNVNSISQAIGTIIYRNKEYLTSRQKMIVRNKEKLYNELVKISEKQVDFIVYKSFANFILIKTPYGKEIFDYLRDNSIVIRHMGEYIRITAGTNYEIDRVVCCIREFFSR